MVELRLLGPLEVARDGDPVPLGGQKQRALLVALALRARVVVSSERLVDDLWGPSPPRTAATSLQNFVSQLRKLLGPGVLVTKAPGYVLDLPPEAIDIEQFERLVAEARAAEPEERVGLLRGALELWRGEPLPELAYTIFGEGEIRRLEELRLAAIEECVEAELALGGHASVIAELEPLVRANPLRERPCGQLMVAFYRSGRQADALQAYQGLRRALVEELGIDPSPGLQALHRAILRQDDTLVPGVRDDEVEEDHYDDVTQALLAGRVVCVLGHGVWDEPVEEGAAAQLASRFGLERDGGLSRLAQLVALRQGLGPLYDELHEAFAPQRPPGPVHMFVASLPAALREAGSPSLLLLTTQYDDALERALAAAGETYDLVAYVAAGRDRGRFLHVAPDGESRVVDVPNTYAELSLDRRPIVVKLHGQADPGEARELESFVVSEDDYIDYLAQSEIANLVPVTIAAKLRRSHFLFLGYPLREWHLRVFLHRVWGNERVAYRSWAVQPAPDPLERACWRQRGVELVDAALSEYVEGLAKRIRERAVATG
jgi:DNA-binding SARP family transcriptional activator